MLKSIKILSKLLSKRPKGWRSVLFNTMMAKAKRAYPLLPPALIAIEPTNACHAKCPVCETGAGTMQRAKGLLDPHDFKALIDKVHPTTAMLMFYYMGEPFLNKHSYEMIRYARHKSIYVETCTNGDYVDPHGVIESNINWISFQIGGLNQKTHGIYRVNSDIERVKKNLYALIELKKQQNKNDLNIELGFIVMRHNEHEVDEFIRWAKALPIDAYQVISPCVRTLEQGELYLPENKQYWIYDEAAFKKGILRPKHVPNNECTWIWNTLQVNWDGRVVPCCRDVNASQYLGNVFQEDLGKIWNGQRAVSFRQQISQHQNKVALCRLCSGYGVPKIHSL